MMPKHELILLKNMMQPGYTGSLTDYEKTGGYQALRKTLGKIAPPMSRRWSEVRITRAEAAPGFPTGVKWGFLPKDYQGPRYLCCNADESEPGTFKDRQLMERDPHQVLEGIVLACYAIGAETAYIYIRGEYGPGPRSWNRPSTKREPPAISERISWAPGSTRDVWVHRGAGAYICGEETALLESLEGKRGLPRVKPPFPATHGSTISRPWSITSRRWRTFPISSTEAPNGLRRSVRRRRAPAPESSVSAAM